MKNFKKKLKTKNQNQAALMKLMHCAAGFNYLTRIDKICDLILTELSVTTSRSTVLLSGGPRYELTTDLHTTA